MSKNIDAFIGIDYGTTSCKLAYMTPPINKKTNIIPNIENVSFNIEGNETSKRFPSSVLFEVKNKKVKLKKGFEVTKIFKDERKLNNLTYELVSSPKLDLGKGIFYPIAPPEFCEPQDLVYLTLDEMLREFERTGIKRKNCKVIITVPSSFGVQQRKEILFALEKLGVDPEDNNLVDEPNAALLGLVPTPLFSTVVRRAKLNNILLLDFGGGTCDISLLKITDDFSNEPYGVEILNLAINDFAELGGNKIDYEVANLVMKQIFHPEKNDLFNDDILKIEATEKLLDRLVKTVAQKSKEQIISELSSNKIRNKRQLKDVFTFNLEKIKIIFKSLITPLEIPRKNKVTIEQSEFETIINKKIRGDLLDINDLITNVIDKANLDHYDIGAVILAGGSSRIFQVPKFKSLLLSLFPHLSENEVITTTDPDLLISRGAALECYNRFFLGRSLIRPISPSNIGIRTAEEDNICLLPAGKGLPYPNQEDRGADEILYVPNTRNRNVKVPLFIENFGSWNIFETWDIALPTEIYPNDKMLFNAKMKLDKTLEVTCRSAKDPTLRFKLTSENWLTNVELTPREQRINELRLKIKKQKKEFNFVQFGDLYDLIWAEYKAGHYSIAKNRCLRFLETDMFTKSSIANLYNYLGLIANAQGKSLEAIQFYIKAKECAPSNSIFNYNVGVSYLWNTTDYILAEQFLSKSLDLDSKSVNTHLYLGDAKIKNYKEHEAKELYRIALSMVKEEFNKYPTKTNTEMFCKICDRLKLEYPDELKQRLANSDTENDINIDVPIGLSDIDLIIRSNPDYKQKKVEDEEE